MSSNLGSAFLNTVPEDAVKIPAETRELVMTAIRGAFLPEFINRLDTIVVFNKLNRREIGVIVGIRLGEIQKRLKESGKNIALDISPAAVAYLAEIGYHPVYGARPLARVLQAELLNPLSRCIIQETIGSNETAHVEFDAAAQRLVIKHNHDVGEGMEVDEDETDEDGDIQIEEVDE